jgi:DNA-directed RNA polymerase
MSTLTLALEEKQLALETEMGSMGVVNYFKNLEAQGQANNRVGVAIIENSISPLVDKLKEFCESTQSGQARRLSSTARYFEMIGLKEVAYITLKRVINGISNRDRMVAMAEGIATLLEDELNYRAFRKEAPRLMDAIIRNLKGTAANDQHKKRVIRGAQTKLAGIEKVALPTELRVKLGVKLIELVSELNLCKFNTHVEGKNKTVIYVEPTDSLQVWLALQNKACSLLSPVFLPMVSKPKAWSTPTDGGYLQTPLTIMKTRNKAYLQELENIDMPVVYEAVNSLQETPWVINKAVYAVMKQLWEQGGGIAKLPYKEGKPIPQKPIDIDTNPLALKEWKGKAAQTHNENFKSRSKVVALSQKLWVAEKFLEEEAIYFPHVIDWRGRAYAVPGFVNPQSDDTGKSLLQFAEGKPLGEEGVAWLAIHLANTFGYDKVDFDKRIEWAEENTQVILDSALKPLDGERFWLLADKPFQFLAACFEWLGYTMQGTEFVSRIAVALDGSCNGLQNFSAMLRDERGGKATNLVPADKPSDIYQEVANEVQKYIEEDAKGGNAEANVWLNALYRDGDVYKRKPLPRKLTKRNTMTRPYSVTAFGMRDQLIQELDTMLEEGDIKFPGDVDVAKIAYYLADNNLMAISSVVVAAEAAMKWLQEVAKVVSANGLPVIWTTPVGLPVRQFYTVQDAEKLRVFIAGSPTWIQFNRHGKELNGRKQSAGISPNFVHSCDAAHMMKTISLCKASGINSFSMIHDSYGVHACDTRRLADNLRQAFVQQYSSDVLATFRDEIIEQLESSGAGELVAKMPPLPQYGTLDLTVVLDSEYFFA